LLERVLDMHDGQALPPKKAGNMDIDTVSPRLRAARLRTLCLRAGAVLVTFVAAAATPAIAAARGRVHARAHAASGAPTCVNAHTRLGRVPHTDTNAAVVCLLNVERQSHGLPAVRSNGRLNDSAQRWTNVMVRDRAFSHGADFAARISAVGFNWSRVGENIADGFSTPSGVVRAWMRSTGHCQNILNPMFREVGSGFDRGTATAGDKHGTWTLDLALGWRQRARSQDFGPAEGCPY
jgi:uncharacterized protein YkwD